VDDGLTRPGACFNASVSGGRVAIGAIFAANLVAPAASGAPSTTLHHDKALSNERTRTAWAHPRSRAFALEHPRYGAREVARLHPRTEDGLGEVYIVLRRHFDRRGREWLRIRMPARPRSLRGWVRPRALARLHVVTTRLVVDRRRLRALYYRRGHRVWSARVGVGKRGTPTPRGKFWIREGFRVPGRTLYGPYAFGTSAYSRLSEWPGGGVVGLHGTNRPGLIPGRPSHGCIRLRNRDIKWLAHRMPVGTPLLVR
jgi:hypothetical protein